MRKTFQYRLLDEQLEECLCACFHQMAASGVSADSDLAFARHPNYSEWLLGEKTTSLNW